MKVVVVAALAASTGCVGLSYRGDVGLSHGKVDRVIVDAAAGIDTRSYQRAADDDHAFLIFWGIGPRVVKQLHHGNVAAGPMTGFGLSYFRGRYGVVALATFGGLFGEADRRERLAVRFQLGVEIEGGASEWRIAAHAPRDCGGYIDTGNTAVNNTHFLFGVLPGVEYFSDGGGRAVSVAASFRELHEPGVCAGLGP